MGAIAPSSGCSVWATTASDDSDTSPPGRGPSSPETSTELITSVEVNTRICASGRVR